MGRRCVDKNCSKNCKYAFLEKTTVRSESYLDGHKKDEFDQDAINVYCNNPSLKKKLYIDFVIILDEYLEPNFPCPIDNEKQSFMSKIINWCNSLRRHNDTVH